MKIDKLESYEERALEILAKGMKALLERKETEITEEATKNKQSA